MAHIALVMMLKNESKRIHVSLQSVVGIVQSIIIFDTGSTDNTIEIVEEFCVQHNIPLYLKTGDFVDFSTSRNELLDFCDTIPRVQFYLLLDCNDELQGGDNLIAFCKKQKTTPESSWHLNQTWFSGAYTSYFNVRLLRAKSHWRYKGVVHEYIQNTQDPNKLTTVKVEGVVLYQDRTKDDDKTGKRFYRDKKLLLEEYDKDPLDGRTVFYLAQTFSCLNEHTESYKYYLERTTLEGFQEEVFHSHLRLGELVRDHLSDFQQTKEYSHFDWNVAQGHFLDALSHSSRVEPLVALAQHYKDEGKWLPAYMFSSMACELPVPTHSVLFINSFDYDYTRFHLLGIIAYYVQRYEDGKNACERAIDAIHADIDRFNLQFYIDALENKKKEQENLKKSLRTTKKAGQRR